jgi:prepilin-type N-terminal cleavage/methylation domain-containing protein
MMPICLPRIEQDRGPSEGFTLIEMLVVLAVISILAVAATFYMGHQPGAIVRAGQMSKLVDAIDRSESLARSEGRPQAIDPGSIIPGATLSPKVVLTVDPTPLLHFYPDGSSNGGIISIEARPLLAVDWLTGEVRRAVS